MSLGQQKYFKTYVPSFSLCLYDWVLAKNKLLIMDHPTSDGSVLFRLPLLIEKVEATALDVFTLVCGNESFSFENSYHPLSLPAAVFRWSFYILSSSYFP